MTTERYAQILAEMRIGKLLVERARFRRQIYSLRYQPGDLRTDSTAKLAAVNAEIDRRGVTQTTPVAD
jgi:hypothetical protein